MQTKQYVSTLLAQAVCQYITSLWESIMCPKPSNCEYHAKKCLMGECSQCGVRKLTFCPNEIVEDRKEVSVKVLWIAEQDKLM